MKYNPKMKEPIPTEWQQPTPSNLVFIDALDAGWTNAIHSIAKRCERGILVPQSFECNQANQTEGGIHCWPEETEINWQI